MILLDSDVLIPVLRKEAAALDALQRWQGEGHDLGASSISVAEVLRGTPPGRKRALARRRLEGLVQVPFGPRAALRFGAMMHDLDRADARIGAMEGMIAASALVEGAVVATRNGSEFARVPGLQIASP